MNTKIPCGLDGTDKNRVPKAKITHMSKTQAQVELPYATFLRCINNEDGRTYNFFTETNQLHEGQQVVVCSYGESGLLTRHGTVQRSQQWPPDKWFVQTPVQPEK